MAEKKQLSALQCKLCSQLQRTKYNSIYDVLSEKITDAA